MTWTRWDAADVGSVGYEGDLYVALCTCTCVLDGFKNHRTMQEISSLIEQ